MSFAPSTGCGNVFSYVRQDRLSEILEVLEGNGYVTPLTVDMCGQTLLHHACSSNAFLCLRAMLEYTNEIDSPDRDGKTPLFVAVENGSMECVKLLCERAAALKVQLSFEPLSGMTPLHAAAVHGRVACIDLLVNDLGHSLNTLDADSRTPLQAGLEETYDPVATLFLHALGGKVNTEKYCVNPPESVFDPLVKTADSDVIFSIDDKNIYGKKSHLIKHCPFFEGMFHFRSLQGRDSQEGTKSMETIQLEVPLGGFVGFLEWSQNKSLYTITNWSTLLESWQMAEMFDLASMQEDLKIHAHSTLRSDPQPGVEYLFFTYCALKTGDLRAFVEDDTHEEKWWPGFSAQTPEAKRDLMSFCASVLRFYVPHILRCTNRDPVILLRELFESANNHQEISYNPICSKRVAEQIYNWCEGETRCTFHYTDFLLDKFPPENCRCDKYDCPSCRLPVRVCCKEDHDIVCAGRPVHCTHCNGIFPTNSTNGLPNIHCSYTASYTAHTKTCTRNTTEGSIPSGLVCPICLHSRHYCTHPRTPSATSPTCPYHRDWPDEPPHSQWWPAPNWATVSLGVACLSTAVTLAYCWYRGKAS